jgi:hypothetical protein
MIKLPQESSKIVMTFLLSNFLKEFRSGIDINVSNGSKPSPGISWKNDAQDLENDSEGPITPTPNWSSTQIEAQFLPQLVLRKLTHQYSNQNFSQIKGLRSVPDFRDLADRIWAL